MAKHRLAPVVMVVEDADDLRTLMAFHLNRAGMETLAFPSAETAWEALREKRVDLALIDLMLPGLDGMSLARHMRREEATRDIALVFVTARGEETDVVAGLELGADDYVTKPFSPKVLLARVRAVLRRHGRLEEEATEADPIIRKGKLCLRPARHEATVNDEAVELTAGEFRMLLAMVRRPGIVFTRERLLEVVHGPNHAVTDRAVDVMVVGLRRKLGSAGNHVETVRGLGYRFVE